MTRRLICASVAAAAFPRRRGPRLEGGNLFLLLGRRAIRSLASLGLARDRPLRSIAFALRRLRRGGRLGTPLAHLVRGSERPIALQRGVRPRRLESLFGTHGGRPIALLCALATASSASFARIAAESATTRFSKRTCAALAARASVSARLRRISSDSPPPADGYPRRTRLRATAAATLAARRSSSASARFSAFSAASARAAAIAASISSLARLAPLQIPHPRFAWLACSLASAATFRDFQPNSGAVPRHAKFLRAGFVHRIPRAGLHAASSRATSSALASRKASEASATARLT